MSRGNCGSLEIQYAKILERISNGVVKKAQKKKKGVG